MREAEAFSPAHITGFFQIHDTAESPLVRGSRGAGVSIKKGVTTTVRLEEAPKASLKVRINGRLVSSAMVSQQVVQMLLSHTHKNYKIQVEHDVQVPIGAGFGSSGAGALSLALALNEALELGFPLVKVGKFAHTAEINCRTGLGTVIAEFFGGVEIRLKPGAPGIGEVKPIVIDKKCVVVCLNFGSLSTSELLGDQKFCQRVNESGGKLVDKLLKKPNIHDFMLFSRSFAENLGLITDRMQRVLKEADQAGLTCSMPMFGESAFSLVGQDRVESLLQIFRKHASPDICVFVSEVDLRGARIL